MPYLNSLPVILTCEADETIAQRVFEAICDVNFLLVVVACWRSAVPFGRLRASESARAYHSFQYVREISSDSDRNFTCNSSPVTTAPIQNLHK